MSWVSFRKGLSDLKRLGSMCRQRQLFHRGFFICTLGVWPQDKEDFRNRCQLAGWCLWGFSAQSLCLLAFLLSFLHWGTQPVLWDLPVARPEALRTGSVVFELTGSPADGVAAQAERAKRGFVWVANLGTLWASFPGFAPWPFLEAASPRPRFQDGFPFIAQTPVPSGLHWLVLSCTVHMCCWGFFALVPL